MGEPLRVLQMIGGLNIGGSQMMIINIYRAIDRSKLQFDFIIDRPNQRALAAEVEALGAKIYEMPTYTGRNTAQIKHAWDAFFTAHPEYKVLHSHVRSYASLYFPIARKHGLKTIIHSHSTSNGKGVASVVKRLMQYPLRHQADYFMGCSKEAGEWLFGKKIVNSPKYRMLQNAIDVGAYKFNPAVRKQYRDELGLNDELTFVHVGRFHVSKNHAFLLNLFQKIHLANANTKLVLIGDGPLRPDLERQIDSLKLSDSVILTGNRNDVPRLLQAADCLLFPSNWEGLPVSVVEAQASGIPCLISDRITGDVGISPLVQYLSIDNGYDEWLNAVAQLDFTRKDVSEQICKAGFDINETAKWLAAFYAELSR